ncbi:hypothetical protein GGP92_003092 [Salinibacter ruber]|nr:hypothetical protein [Salinibacter ruber]
MAEQFEDLRAWKTAWELTNCVYAWTKTEDVENHWALKD